MFATDHEYFIQGLTGSNCRKTRSRINWYFKHDRDVALAFNVQVVSPSPFSFARLQRDTLGFLLPETRDDGATGDSSGERSNKSRTWTHEKLRVILQFICAGIRASVMCNPCWRDPTKSKQLSTISTNLLYRFLSCWRLTKLTFVYTAYYLCSLFVSKLSYLQ